MFYFIVRTDTKMHLQLLGPHFDRSGWHLPNVVIFQVPENKKFVEFNVVRRFVIVTGSYIKGHNMER
jgi:hypothetical protein